MKRNIAMSLIACLLMILIFQPCSVNQAKAAAKEDSKGVGANLALSGKGTTETVILSRSTMKYASPVSKNGRLKVKGTKLVNKNGKPIQLKGVSSHGINWDVGKPYVNESALKTLRKWGANCFRISMYTEDYNGYCVTDPANRKELRKTIDTGVKAAKKLGMYAIIDWHVLNDQNPKKHQKEAKAFFKNMSKKYKKYNNVLYEICNEPNGGTSWETIKSYAKAVIPVIRKNSKNAIIIVGTPNWSQDVDIASQSPLKGYRNIMYAVHFYAATHKDSYRQKVQTAIDNKLPVICTEFSACEASGNGAYDFQSAREWLKLLQKNKIGYVCWSLSNKPEAASLLKASCKRTGGFQKSDLSPMGNWLVSKY